MIFLQRVKRFNERFFGGYGPVTVSVMLVCRVGMLCGCCI
jgi:hypothetical protein